MMGREGNGRSPAKTKINTKEKGDKCGNKGLDFKGGVLRADYEGEGGFAKKFFSQT